MPKPIIVALSGGVDSAVSAYLLKEQGYSVSALFMKNWEEDDTAEYCSASQDIADAEAVCAYLKIPLQTINFAAEYWDNVFTYFLQEYRAGRTPNPDILCNKEIKFKAFLDFVRQQGIDCMATGHYAQLQTTPHGLQLLQGNDSNKDQSYFLYTLSQAQLQHACFPVGHLPKAEVRQIAARAGLSNYNKKDSTGICFIGERKFKTFLSQYLPAQPGDIESPEGKRLGQHDGLMYYTVGQRQGLGIGGHRAYAQAPWYVVGKDLKRNVLIVGQGHDHPLLFSDQLICQDVHWIAGAPPASALVCQAKIRYRQPQQPCQVEPLNATAWRVRFATPQRAITPGQSVVFYADKVCLGGGVIA